MSVRKVGRARTRKSSPKKPLRPVNAERTLALVVGPQTYAVWVYMLRALVPHGRTHRLSVVVAGMLRHAADVAYRRYRDKAPRGSVAASLLLAMEEVDPEQIGDEVGDVVKRLFRDARVSADRVSARGDAYSIIDGAIQEFVVWEDMPWE